MKYTQCTCRMLQAVQELGRDHLHANEHMPYCLAYRPQAMPHQVKVYNWLAINPSYRIKRCG